MLLKFQSTMEIHKKGLLDPISLWLDQSKDFFFEVRILAILITF